MKAVMKSKKCSEVKLIPVYDYIPHYSDMSYDFKFLDKTSNEEYILNNEIYKTETKRYSTKLRIYKYDVKNEGYIPSALHFFSHYVLRNILLVDNNSCGFVGLFDDLLNNKLFYAHIRNFNLFNILTSSSGYELAIKVHMCDKIPYLEMKSSTAFK